ncbi:hypothetical protein ACFFVB_04455 [Formosa undariae]|uniref:Uncharacterized protein n=1 Tax=Formosa undariae TaxID=1325436 RepID=A0ABV5EYQ3_9FLAO
MKHILLCVVCLLCVNISTAKPVLLNNTNTTVVKDQGNNQFKPILIDRQYISEQSLQFINQEISFVRVLEEASKFWQSDAKRSERWEPRVEKYINDLTYSNYEITKVKQKLNLEQSSSDIDKLIGIITSESIAEFSREIAFMGFAWVLMAVIVLCTKGKFFVFDIVLTTFICVWFGLKNQIIKDNLEDFTVLKNERLIEMASGNKQNSKSQKGFKSSKELSGIIHFLE